jgi:transcriptional regulator with XRE-family HTH domain
MNRKEFGKLIASLRRDMGWTQEQLAHNSGIDEPIISQIERGVKRHFSSEQLVALANAFQMITLERREFFLAASGVEPEQIARPNLPQVASDTASPERELEKIEQLMSKVRGPAFVRDSYNDIILANGATLALFGLDPTKLQALLADNNISGNLRPKFNVIHFIFAGSQPVRSQLDPNQDWDTYVLNTMRVFRVSTLRYRAKPYFEYLMQNFQNPALYPSFDRYWKLAYSVEQDVESSAYTVDYQNQSFGKVEYISLTTPITTVFGELYLVLAQPLNENAEHLFAEFSRQSGTNIYRFASWPDKNIPGATR